MTKRKVRIESGLLHFVSAFEGNELLGCGYIAFDSEGKSNTTVVDTTGKALNGWFTYHVLEKIVCVVTKVVQ